MGDNINQETGPMAEWSVGDDELDLELTTHSESGERVKKIVIASVLASLSIAIAPVAEIVPRIPGWGIAIFDPVSFFWIISFLLGGIWVGLVSTIDGTMGLFLYDPTAVGPFFKLVATLPMILVPWYGVRKLKNTVGGESLLDRSEETVTPLYHGSKRKNLVGGEALSGRKLYVTLMLLGFVLRLALMIPINLLYGAIAYPFFTMEFIINYVIIINSFQSLFDALIPFLIVYPTGIFKNFKMW
jgi:hypothetical protein